MFHLVAFCSWYCESEATVLRGSALRVQLSGEEEQGSMVRALAQLSRASYIARIHSCSSSSRRVREVSHSLLHCVEGAPPASAAGSALMGTRSCFAWAERTSLWMDNESKGEWRRECGRDSRVSVLLRSRIAMVISAPDVVPSIND